jgi:hypothetical protein
MPILFLFLGVVVFEMLIGYTPFYADSVDEICNNIVELKVFFLTFFFTFFLFLLFFFGSP